MAQPKKIPGNFRISQVSTSRYAIGDFYEDGIEHFAFLPPVQGGVVPSPPTDRRFGPLLFVSIPFIVIAAFILVAFVGWHVSAGR